MTLSSRTSSSISSSGRLWLLENGVQLRLGHGVPGRADAILCGGAAAWRLGTFRCEHPALRPVCVCLCIDKSDRHLHCDISTVCDDL